MLVIAMLFQFFSWLSTVRGSLIEQIFSETAFTLQNVLWIDN